MTTATHIHTQGFYGFVIVVVVKLRRRRFSTLPQKQRSRFSPTKTETPPFQGVARSVHRPKCSPTEVFTSRCVHRPKTTDRSDHRPRRLLTEVTLNRSFCDGRSYVILFFSTDSVFVILAAGDVIVITATEGVVVFLYGRLRSATGGFTLATGNFVIVNFDDGEVDGIRLNCWTFRAVHRPIRTNPLPQNGR